MKRKPQIGETLYGLNIGNASRRGVEQKLTPMVVTAVGRKFFNLKKKDGMSLSISTLIHGGKKPIAVKTISSMRQNKNGWMKKKSIKFANSLNQNSNMVVIY